MQGLMHIYTGEGKGKTTAAVGLGVRAAGAGKTVLFAQFLKDGSSSRKHKDPPLRNSDRLGQRHDGGGESKSEGGLCPLPQ